MSDPGAALARAAESLAGTRFRLHGRDRATGLDCVGLVAAALAIIGRNPPVPLDYGLRNGSIDAALAYVPGAGFASCPGETLPGDLLLVSPGPAQHHLMVALDGARFVHAHAGLRRVVVTPGPLQWPQLRQWRLRS